MKKLMLCVLSGILALSAHAQDGVGIIAHRGAWNCPEAGYSKNSIAALVQAQAKGYYGSEFDVNMCSDGTLLVCHDSEIDGKLIEKNPASAFSELRLDEYLIQAAKSDRTKLIFELKAHSNPKTESLAVQKSIEALKRHGLFDPERVCFISFSFHICQEFVRLAPGFDVSFLGHFKSLRPIQKAGINGIDSYYPLLLRFKGKVRRAHKMGMDVNCWTVNDEKAIRKMIEIGVDYITTDQPELVREILKQLQIEEK